MNTTAHEVLRVLHDAFPQRVVAGVITPHECDECAAIRRELSGRTWREVPSAFADEFSGSLPLLSPDAYNAYLPVWLRAAVENPDGEAATMIAINLSYEPSKTGFTAAQAHAIVATVEFVAAHNWCGSGDPVNIERLAAVKREWGGDVA